MRKITLLLLLFAGMANAQIVNIPDANFKTVLLSANATNNIAQGATIDTKPMAKYKCLKRASSHFWTCKAQASPI